MSRKAVYLLSALLVLCGLVYGVRSAFDGLALRGCDLSLRIHEVQCAHAGVNPFHVWDRTVEVPGFYGHDRPDMENVPAQDRVGRHEVHAYPPWHTTFFWFYGWLPPAASMVLLCIACGVAVVFIVQVIKRSVASLERAQRVFVWSWIVALLFGKFVCVFAYLQYGIVLAGLALLMYNALDKGRDWTAAVYWALMMVKPQVGALFFFPLLFGRKYKVILLTGAICFLATLWPAWVYHESPVRLILDVPKIGAPYAKGPIVEKVLAPLIGNGAAFVWAGACAAVCAVGSWMFRKSGGWLVRTLPVMWIFPLWTYSHVYDHVVTWSLVLAWGMLAAGAGGDRLSPSARRILYACTGAEMLWLLFSAGWHLGIAARLFNPSGIGWIYASAETLLAWTVVPAVLFLVLLPAERARPPLTAP